MVEQTPGFPRYTQTVERVLGGIDREVARILDRALSGHDITAEEGTRLFEAEGPEVLAITLAADDLRRRTVGDIVTYVVNRNVNFTNVCIKHCGFCAFSRDHREEEGYFLPIEEVVRRAKEAWEVGATEVCIQAGLPPKMEGDLYLRLAEAIKRELPGIHIHAFSPEEVLYGAVRSRVSIEDYLRALKDAGVDSLPGTSAEILDDRVRHQISPGRISTEDWITVITTAHRLGIPTTSTIMYGHVETMADRARHIALIRDIQRGTGGITEFVPLSFVAEEAPMYRKKLLDGFHLPTGLDVVKMYAVSRIMLNNWIPNIQVSWVKEGLKLAQWCLQAGGNDFMGTLINESISTAAGAQHGQLVRPRELREHIRAAGRTPAERNTLYRKLRVFETEPETPDPLDTIEDTDRFGSYFQLIHLDRFRYEDERRRRQEAGRPGA